MTTSRELAKQGLCEMCQHPVPHGPYTDAELDAIAADLGTDPAEAFDWCDNCLLHNCFADDRPYAERLLERPLTLRSDAMPTNITPITTAAQRQQKGTQ